MASKRPWLIHGIRRSRTHQMDNRRITPLAYVLGIRWPGGGWLWQTPWAVEVVHEEHEGDRRQADIHQEDAHEGAGQQSGRASVRRLPILNLNRIVLLLLVLGTSFYLVGLWRSRAAHHNKAGEQTRR